MLFKLGITGAPDLAISVSMAVTDEVIRESSWVTSCDIPVLGIDQGRCETDRM